MQTSNKQTIGAIPVAFVLLFVGLFVGGLVKMVYTAYLVPLVTGGIFNWVSDGLFGEVTLQWFPEIVQGAIGGALGIYLTALLFRRADYAIVVYALGTLVIAVTLFGMFVGFMQRGLDLSQVALIANTGGIVAGLIIGQQSVKESQPAA